MSFILSGRRRKEDGSSARPTPRRSSQLRSARCVFESNALHARKTMSIAVLAAAISAIFGSTGADASGDAIVVGYEPGVSAYERGEILASSGAVPDRSVVGLRADRAITATRSTSRCARRACERSQRAVRRARHHSRNGGEQVPERSAVRQPVGPLQLRRPRHRRAARLVEQDDVLEDRRPRHRASTSPIRTS